MSFLYGLVTPTTFYGGQVFPNPFVFLQFGYVYACSFVYCTAFEKWSAPLPQPAPPMAAGRQEARPADIRPLKGLGGGEGVGVERLGGV